MAWVFLSIAGVLEIVFAVLLKLSNGFTKPAYVAGVCVAAGLSLYFLTRAMQDIPMGTAYAVWTGVGALGIVLIGIFFFNESTNWLRLLFIALLVFSIGGLKFVSNAT